MATKHSSGTSKPKLRVKEQGSQIPKPAEERVRTTDHSDPFEMDAEKAESSFLLCQAVQRLTALFECLPIESPTEFLDRDREHQATMLGLMHDLVVQADQAAKQHFGETSYCVSLEQRNEERNHG